MNEPVGNMNWPRVTAGGAVTRQVADALRAAQSSSIDTAAFAEACAPSLEVTRQVADALRAAQSFSIDTAAFAEACAPSLEVTRQVADALRAAQSFSSVHTRSTPELDNPGISAPPTRLEKLGELRESLAREEAAQRATASQIDELLVREVTSGVAGTCWGCGNATLVPGGVTCTFCAGPIAEMFYDTWSVTEPPESY